MVQRGLNPVLLNGNQTGHDSQNKPEVAEKQGIQE